MKNFSPIGGRAVADWVERIQGKNRYFLAVGLGWHVERIVGALHSPRRTYAPVARNAPLSARYPRSACSNLAKIARNIGFEQVMLFYHQQLFSPLFLFFENLSFFI